MFSQEVVVDFVAIVLKDQPLGRIAVDQIAAETHIVVKLGLRKFLAVEKITGSGRIVAAGETESEGGPGRGGNRNGQHRRGQNREKGGA